MPIETDLKELASAIAKKAATEDVPLAEKVDVLKALTGLYVALKRHGAGPEDIPSGESTFEDIANGITALRLIDGARKSS